MPASAARRPGTVEPPAILLGGDDAEQDLAEALDRLGASLSVRGRDPGALRLRQPPLQLAPALGQFEQALSAVHHAAMLDDKALAQQLTEHAVQTLLGDTQDLEQLPDGHLGMTADEVDDPVMGPAEAIFLEDRVGLGGEVAIGEEQQLDAVAHLLLAWEGGGGSGYCWAHFMSAMLTYLATFDTLGLSCAI